MRDITLNEAYAHYVIQSERIPAEKFLDLNSRQRGDIVSTTIVPPTFRDDFGFIEVEYKEPKYLIDSVFK